MQCLSEISESQRDGKNVKTQFSSDRYDKLYYAFIFNY